jgi:hypothetical protein
MLRTLRDVDTAADLLAGPLADHDRTRPGHPHPHQHRA